MPGKIIQMRRFDPDTCRKFPHALFVFGDNMAGKGTGGQAIIRYESNAIGIPTKWRPGTADRDYFCDLDLGGIVRQRILGRFANLRQALLHDRDVIWPRDGIGTGLAQLKKRAPAVLAFIIQQKLLLDGVVENGG